MKNLIAKATIIVNAPASIVWGALTKPKIIKQYYFGTDTITDWKIGSPIIWKGEWQGKQYKDKGKILKFEKNRILSYSHFSPLSGKPDVEENYHNITIELELNEENQTVVTLEQDNNPTEDARKHSEKNWQMVLDGLKKLLEKYLSENPSCRIEDMEK